MPWKVSIGPGGSGWVLLAAVAMSVGVIAAVVVMVLFWLVVVAVAVG